MVLAGAVAWAAAAPAMATDQVVLRFPHPDSEVRFADDYGFERKDKGPDGEEIPRPHRGVDIFSPRGTPVVAVADGFVLAARHGTRAGYYVALRHADEWESWYMHLDTLGPAGEGPFGPGIEVGAFVKAGQVLGAVGTTGNAHGTHPHTHFELHHYGRFTNPYPHLVESWDRQLLDWAIEAGEAPFH